MIIERVEFVGVYGPDVSCCGHFSQADHAYMHMPPQADTINSLHSADAVSGTKHTGTPSSFSVASGAFACSYFILLH